MQQVPVNVGLLELLHVWKLIVTSSLQNETHSGRQAEVTGIKSATQRQAVLTYNV